jgi:hypothetical protein
MMKIVNWIHLTLDMVQCRVLVKIIMNFRASEKMGDLFDELSTY